MAAHPGAKTAGMDHLLNHLISSDGFIARRDHPKLAHALTRAKQSGELIVPLPGFFLPPGAPPSAWLRAVSAWAAPLGVIHAGSAASPWLPEHCCTIHLAHPTLRSRAGVTVTKRLIPREFVTTVAGIRLVTPGYAAVELAGIDDGRALCEALRQNLVRTKDLPALLDSLAGTAHQRARRTAVQGALRNPWSFAELRLHRILLTAGITGWVANQQIRCGGTAVIPDVRFLAAKLVIEFDGRNSHEHRFLADRERQNRLEAAGFRVIRFGWEHLDQPEYIVATVKMALRSA
jgi:very-short-patch-repair endonuclease